MSKLPGIAMVMAGVAVAAYAFQPQAGVSTSPDPFEEIQAPQVVLKVTEAPAVAAWQTTLAPAASESVTAPSRSASTPTRRVAVAEVPLRIPIGPVAQGEWGRGAAPASDRATLAREIQRHLKRVGCYDGEVNGVWSPSSRRAMKAFTDRVNATLPVEAPDFVLLAMVESHASQACGRPCAQGESDQTHCVPSAIITATAKSRSVDGAVPPTSPLPLEGRMALAGPSTVGPESESANTPSEEIATSGPRVDKSNATPQRRDRQRSRSAASKSLPAWAIPRAMP
jgi:hypothetical protein